LNVKESTLHKAKPSRATCRPREDFWSAVAHYHLGVAPMQKDGSNQPVSVLMQIRHQSALTERDFRPYQPARAKPEPNINSEAEAGSGAGSDMTVISSKVPGLLVINEIVLNAGASPA